MMMVFKEPAGCMEGDDDGDDDDDDDGCQRAGWLYGRWQNLLTIVFPEVMQKAMLIGKDILELCIIKAV